MSQINSGIGKIVKGNYLKSGRNISLVVKKKDGINGFSMSRDGTRLFYVDQGADADAPVLKTLSLSMTQIRM